ncbi:MAG: ATP-binding protein [Acidobacteriota bacterium]
MRVDRLGKTFTLLSILLILGLGAINLFTVGLYGRVNSELVSEQQSRQQLEATHWALEITMVLRGRGSLDMRFSELATHTTSGPAAIGVYRPNGELQTTWIRPPISSGEEIVQNYLAERGKLQSLLPTLLPVSTEPCRENTLADLRAHAVRSRIQKLGQTSYTVFTVPIFHPIEGGECGAFSMLIFYTARPPAAWPLLALLLQILVIVTIVAGGFALLRIWLRPFRARPQIVGVGEPAVVSTGSRATEFLVGTLQALIDGLQVEREELVRHRDLERKRAAFIEQFNERIVASITAGLVVVEHTGYVVIVNGQAGTLFNGDREQVQELQILRGMRYEVFFQRAPRLCQLIAACLQDGRRTALEEFEAQRLDGSPCLLAVTVSPMRQDSADSIQGALCLISDLSEVMELRQRLRLQENLANLGEMAAGIAHEFKNSLAAISGYGQLLQSIADTRGQTWAHALVTEVHHLSQVVTDFLNFARPQKLQRMPISLQDIIEDCCDTMLSKADQHGVTIKLKGELPEVLGDPTLLRRAFLNLIDNGIEAIPADATVKLITLSGIIDLADNQVSIEINDTGSGIPATELNKIFIPFFTTKSRGYGIGLALVQKIFLAHEGSVKVVSQEGVGSTFTCSLPLAS